MALVSGGVPDSAAFVSDREPYTKVVSYFGQNDCRGSAPRISMLWVLLILVVSTVLQ